MSSTSVESVDLDVSDDTPLTSISSLHDSQAQVLDSRKDLIHLERLVASERRKVTEEHLKYVKAIHCPWKSYRSRVLPRLVRE